MKTFFTYLLSRLRERSTWLGLLSLATALGVTLSPETGDAIISAGMALAGLVAMVTRDAAGQ